MYIDRHSPRWKPPVRWLALLCGLACGGSLATPAGAQTPPMRLIPGTQPAPRRLTAGAELPFNEPRAEAQASTEGTFARQIEVEVGDQVVLDILGVEAFSEGTPGIIDARPTRDSRKLVLVGRNPGETTLLFIMKDGSRLNHHITVIDSDPGWRFHSTAVQVRDNIRLDFYFVQLSTSYRHNLGVAWPANVDASGILGATLNLQTGAFSAATATVSAQVLPRLDLAQSSGWAKLQRKAAVITANGAKANFSGGSEVNVPISGGFGGSLEQIYFGSRIEVLPRYDKDLGRIELQVTADVSDIADDNGTGVPGRVTSTLNTIVNLELGQALVLAGLSAESEAKTRAGLPGLSQIPIIGALFGSHGSQVSELENVVFIVPSVMDTVSGTDRRNIDEALQSYLDFSGDLDDVPPPLRFSTRAARGKR